MCPKITFFGIEKGFLEYLEKDVDIFISLSIFGDPSGK
jgi:hypothetical protein